MRWSGLVAYTEATKAKFKEKNQRRTWYKEAIDQIENTPEVAVVEGREEYKGLDEGRKGASGGLEKGVEVEEGVEVEVGNNVSSTHRVPVAQVRDSLREMGGRWC